MDSATLQKLSERDTKAALTVTENTEDIGKTVIANLIDGVEGICHIIFGMLGAFFFGWIGWHVSWAIFLMIGVYFLDRRHNERGWELRFRRYLREELFKRTIVSDGESTEWLNLILIKFFPIYSPGISDSIEAAAINAIDAALETPPAGVTHVSVAEISLGKVPPTLHKVRALNLPGFEYQMSADLRYEGDCKVMVVVGVGMSKMDMDVPITLRNLQLNGRLRIGIRMSDKPPLYKSVSVCFREPPTLDFELEPGRSFDINSIPKLGPWLRSTIVGALESVMVYPHTIPIELGEAPPANLGDATEVVGILKVNVMNAKRLKAADKRFLKDDSSDPYVVVHYGPDKKKTAVKKTTLNPVWNEKFDFKVVKGESILSFEVIDDDVSGSDFLGSCQFDFSHLLGESDSAVEETGLALSGGNINQGELHFSVQFIADD